MANDYQTQDIAIRVMAENGLVNIPADSEQGRTYKPFASGEAGGRLATLETLYDFFIDNVPDPDHALMQNPDFDEVIRQQPDVHAAMRIRELTVASLPVKIEAAKGDEVDGAVAKKIAEYVQERLDALPNRVDLYRQMQNAVLMGGQGVEFTWVRRKVDNADIPVAYDPVDKSRFVFDRRGNMSILTREYPVYGAFVARNPQRMPTGDMAWRIVSGGKFMYHKYMAQGGPWHRPASEGYIYWGRGEDANLYIPVTFDHFVLRFQMKWLEKHGMPLTVLYYPENSDLQSQVMQICESLRQESIVRIPRPVGGDGARDTFNDWYKVEFINPPSEGYDAFSAFHDTWTAPRIEKILLGGSGLLSGGSDSGGYASDVDRRDSGQGIIFRYDAMNIDESMNTQVIPYVVWGKWPGMPEKYFPKHKMEPKEEVDQNERIELLTKTSESVPVREADFYEAAGIRKPAENEPYVFNSGANMGAGAFDSFPNMRPGGDISGNNGRRPGAPPFEGSNGGSPKKLRKPIGEPSSDNRSVARKGRTT